MPLSISKLETFLQSCEMMINSYYTFDDLCFYIEVFSIKSSDIFLLYIPSKYEFKMVDSSYPIYKLKDIDIEDPDQYGDDSVQETHFNIGAPDENYQKNLENRYKTEISLDLLKKDIPLLRSYYRQIKRLGNSTKNIPYKLGIQQDMYMCVTRRDDSIEVKMVQGISKQETRLLIITDLENLFEKKDVVIFDLKQVKDGIYSTLDKNIREHSNNVGKLSRIEQFKDLSLIAVSKASKYNLYLKKLENMLEVMTKAENGILKDIYDINLQASTDTSMEMTRLQKKNFLEKELDKIIGIKTEISKNIILTRSQKDKFAIRFDSVMFDNTIMISKIIENFSLLERFC